MFKKVCGIHLVNVLTLTGPFIFPYNFRNKQKDTFARLKITWYVTRGILEPKRFRTKHVYIQWNSTCFVVRYHLIEEFQFLKKIGRQENGFGSF